jgi:hypothetical protein
VSFNVPQHQSDLFALGVSLFRMFTGQYRNGEIEPFSKPRFAERPLPFGGCGRIFRRGLIMSS